MDRPPLWTQPVETPECPEGWRTGPPDFVGIGAQRSGTSWWWDAALRTHPRVKASPLGKEVHFFERYWQEGVEDDFVERYHSLFPRPPDGVTGEWTPRYMCDFWTMRLLREAAPEARILVLLRDPVERYRSAVARLERFAEERGEWVRLASVSDAAWRGHYAEQLEHVFSVYPREQVLVLQFERCVTDPVGEMRRTCRFIGLTPRKRPPDRLTLPREGRSKREMSPGLRDDLVEHYRADVARLAELCPEVDISLWPNFRRLAPALAGA